MDKILGDVREALSDIHDGATVLLGGFSASGTPFNLMRTLVEQGRRDLTVVANSAVQWWPFVESGQARRVIAGFTNDPRRPSVTRLVNDLVVEGRLEIETLPHGTLEERLRAAGMGIGAFYTTAGAGTEVAAGKETRVIDGQEHVLEHALRADFALVKGWKADRWGNVVCRLGSGNRNIVMACAARTTIVEVDEVVPLGELDPNRVDIPGIFVQRVVRAPKVIYWVHRDTERVDQFVAKAARPARGLTRELIAMRAAQELEDGMYVNLGFGLPTMVSNFLPEGREIVLHAEHGTLGYGPIIAEEEQWDIDMLNAAGQPVTGIAGTCFSDFAASFGMIRGRHLDVSVLGAYQVSEKGDLANWRRPDQVVGSIGGAMELATGAKRRIVVMEHTTSNGQPRIVKECSYPATARRAINAIITNLAYIEVTRDGLVLKETAPGVTVEVVRAATEPALLLAPDLREMAL